MLRFSKRIRLNKNKEKKKIVHMIVIHSRRTIRVRSRNTIYFSIKNVIFLEFTLNLNFYFYTCTIDNTMAHVDEDLHMSKRILRDCARIHVYTNLKIINFVKYEKRTLFTFKYYLRWALGVYSNRRILCIHPNLN